MGNTEHPEIQFDSRGRVITSALAPATLDGITFLVLVQNIGPKRRVQAALVRGPFNQAFDPEVENWSSVDEQPDAEIDVLTALWQLLGAEYAKRKRAEFVP
jgi:hypothetical protein